MLRVDVGRPKLMVGDNVRSDRNENWSKRLYFYCATNDSICAKDKMKKALCRIKQKGTEFLLT